MAPDTTNVRGHAEPVVREYGRPVTIVKGLQQPLTGQTSGYANAAGLYANYQLTEKMSLNGRAEYATSSSAATFGSRKVVETTATLQYDLWKNVLSRLEFRWDHSADGANAYGGSVVGSPELKNSYILLADVAYKF